MKFNDIFKVFKKNQPCDSRYPYYQPLMVGLHDKLIHSGNYDIASAYASSYYRNVQPLYDAIERIATALGSIKPRVWDNEKEEWTDHEVLDLLKAPDGDLTWSEFFSNSGRWLMLAGNTEWVAGGKVNEKPIEVRAVNPQYVTAQRIYFKTQSGRKSDPYAGMYELHEPWGASQFNRYENNKERQFRYYNADKDLEIYHIKNFTTVSGSLFGLSILNPIYYEMEQYISLSIHNLALMKNGARAGLVIKVENQLSPDQEDRLHAEIDQIYAGEYNANRTIILNGAMDAVDLGKTNKEMDYVKLRKSILDGIYSTFRIPLPMVSADRMTLSNYAVSQLMLYDHTIEPYANKLFEELTRFLMPRYGDVEGRYSITFDNRDISALESRRNEQVKTVKDVGVLTTNELRLELGYDEIKGDEVNSIFIPQNFRALDGQDEQQDEMQEEEKPETEDEAKEEEKSYVGQFREILKSYKQNGKRLFSDKEIDNLSKEIKKS